jgi:transcriptional regulator with XRE-family HTH domain
MDFGQREAHSYRNFAMYSEISVLKFQTVKNVFTRQEIADAIGISKRTLERRIKDADLDLPRHLLTAEHVLLIYGTLGVPLPDFLKGFRE